MHNSIFTIEMSSLKTKFVLKNLEKTLINERKNTIKLIEAIDKDLLNKFKIVIQQGDELEELFGSINWKEFLRVVRELNIGIKNELKKSTDFFGNDKSIRGRIKSWLQKHWQNSNIQRFEYFVDDLDTSIKQILSQLEALVPEKNRNSDSSLGQSVSVGLDDIHTDKQTLEIISNGFSIRDQHPRIRVAIIEASKSIFDMGIEQLRTLSEMIHEIKSHIDNEISNIENTVNATSQNKETPKSSDKEIESTPNQDTSSKPNLTANDIVDALSNLKDDDYKKIIRYINAKRKLSTVNT